MVISGYGIWLEVHTIYWGGCVYITNVFTLDLVTLKECGFE